MPGRRGDLATPVGRGGGVGGVSVVGPDALDAAPHSLVARGITADRPDGNDKGFGFRINRDAPGRQNGRRRGGPHREAGAARQIGEGGVEPAQLALRRW
eukprot:11199300-Lingulodinium_polyedra.AAC.1